MNNILDRFLQIWLDVLSPSTAFLAITSDVNFLMAMLAAISIVLMMLWFVFQEQQEPFGPTTQRAAAIRWAIMFSFISFMVSNWVQLGEMVQNGFIRLGFQAAGVSVPNNSNLIISPSEVLMAGWSIAKVIFISFSSFDVAVNAYTILLEIFMIAISAILIFLTYLFMAAQVVVFYIEFKLAILVGFIFIPFTLVRLFDETAWKMINYVLQAGVRFFLLTVLLKLGLPVVNESITTYLNTISTGGGSGMMESLLIFFTNPWDQPDGEIVTRLKALMTITAVTFLMLTLSLHVPSLGQALAESAIKMDASSYGTASAIGYFGGQAASKPASALRGSIRDKRAVSQAANVRGR